jgi:CrcB protein
MGILFIGIGGGLGAISRYLLSELSLRFIPLDYPLGTLAVNAIYR